jgi:hypothetical protein
VLFGVLFTVYRKYNDISQRPPSYVQRKTLALEEPKFGETKQPFCLETFRKRQLADGHAMRCSTKEGGLESGTTDQCRRIDPTGGLKKSQ